MRVFIISLAVVLLSLSSFAASKREIAEQNRILLEQLKADNRANVQPTRTARVSDPCVELSLAESEFFRAAGTAIAADESKAKSAAAVDARNQLARMIRVVVDGASKDYTANTNDSSTTRTKVIGEEIMSQYVYQSIELTKPIQWSLYDLSDGRVQAYVCIEMIKRPDEIEIEMRERVDVEVTISETKSETKGENSATTGATRATQQRLNRPAVEKNPAALNVSQNPEAETLFLEGRAECVAFKHETGLVKVMRAVEMGSIAAQYYMGMMYLYGDNVDQDSTLAFQYLLSAANNGDEKAIFQVAEMYASGTGVEKSKEQARYWYQRSADLGNGLAERRIWNL